MAARQPLVVYIDDLHWADADSAVLLEELLRPPHAPPILTIACLRTEEIASKPFLQALLERTGSKAGIGLALEPMTDDEARTLLACALAVDAPVGGEELLQITREAGGNPFLLRQLAGYLTADPTRRHRVTFAEMLDERVRALPREGQRFLETLAICGRPMAPDLVCDACGVTRERQSLVARLRSSHFIRSSGSSERVETYHDRIREALAAQVAPGAVRRIHGRMVQALVERGSDDCEALFEHYRGAGDDENASMQAGLAAAKASARARVRSRRVVLPGGAGVAARITGRRRVEGRSRRRAGERRPTGRGCRILSARCGRTPFILTASSFSGARPSSSSSPVDLDRGLDLIRAVLAGMGMRAPRSRRAALAWLLWRRARLRWRGLRFVPKPADAIDSDTLLRLDTCWSAATGLAFVDLIAASEFNIRHLQMALDAGDSYRIARGMAIESAARGGSPRGRAFGERLARESKALAKRIGNPHAIALSILADGFIAMMSGPIEECLDARRAGGGDPARPVRRGDMGIEYRAESRAVGPAVPRRAR